MTHLCVTCGTQFPPADHPPAQCPICDDERQFVGLQGQQWITLVQLRRTHRNTLFQEGEGIWGISTVPAFGIGQRALLIRTKNGNILWDCVSLIDADTVALIEALGGISAIAISHPHYYTSMVEWNRRAIKRSRPLRFDGALRLATRRQYGPVRTPTIRL